jgi:uncharacterized protein YbjT (DUF2867 family)
MVNGKHDIKAEKLLVRIQSLLRSQASGPLKLTYPQITGTTGYIGFKTLLIALERGYRVKAIVRKESNVEDLREKNQLVARSYGNGQLEFVVIPEFTDTAAIEAALDGVTAIIHLASPLAKVVSGSYVSIARGRAAGWSDWTLIE